MNIDKSFEGDDEYLLYLMKVVKDIVEKDIDIKFEDLADDDLPDALVHAMLLLIGNFYANRESISYSNITEVPYSYKYILSMFRDYTNCGI